MFWGTDRLDSESTHVYLLLPTLPPSTLLWDFFQAFHSIKKVWCNLCVFFGMLSIENGWYESSGADASKGSLLPTWSDEAPDHSGENLRLTATCGRKKEHWDIVWYRVVQKIEETICFWGSNLVWALALCLVVVACCFCFPHFQPVVFARARDSSGCMNCATEAPHQLWEAEFGLVLKTAGFMDEMNGNFKKKSGSFWHRNNSIFINFWHFLSVLCFFVPAFWYHQADFLTWISAWQRLLREWCIWWRSWHSWMPPNCHWLSWCRA